MSIRGLLPDPFDNIDKYEVGKIYKCKVIKIMEFGFFATLEENLICLCHQSEYSHTKKNIHGKKLFSVGQEIDLAIKEIQKDQRRISLSFKDTIPIPLKNLRKNTNWRLT